MQHNDDFFQQFLKHTGQFHPLFFPLENELSVNSFVRCQKFFLVAKHKNKYQKMTRFSLFKKYPTTNPLLHNKNT